MEVAPGDTLGPSASAPRLPVARHGNRDLVPGGRHSARVATGQSNRSARLAASASAPSLAATLPNVTGSAAGEAREERPDTAPAENAGTRLHNEHTAASRKKIKGGIAARHRQDGDDNEKTLAPDEVDFRETLALRDYRSDLLHIRSTIQDYIATKYRSVRELFAAMDLDCDGKISMQDWVVACKQLNFPISDDKAVKMFRAIDINGDNALSYPEMVSVLEPATLTSMPKSRKELDELTGLSGFLSFTKRQTELLRVDPDGTLLAEALREQRHRDGIFTGRNEPPPSKLVLEPIKIPKTETWLTRVLENAGARADAVDPAKWIVRKTHEKSRNERLEDIRQTIEWEFQARSMSGGKKFLELWRHHDDDKNGYLDHREFRVLLGKDGLNLKLREEDEQLLMDELSDENGAIEPKDFTKYLATPYAPAGDMFENGRNLMLNSLYQKLKKEEVAVLSDAPRFGPPPPVERKSRPTIAVPESPTRDLNASGSLNGTGSLLRRTGPVSPMTVTQSMPLLATSPHRSPADRLVRPRRPSREYLPTQQEVNAGARLGDAAQNLIETVKSMKAKPFGGASKAREELFKDTRYLTTGAEGTAYFATAADRFNPALDAVALSQQEKATRLARRMNRAIRAQDAVERIANTYAHEQRLKDEAERRRIVSKSRQQLRYQLATVFGTN